MHVALILILQLNAVNSEACSTFKLQYDGQLVYCHNLNEADIGVPGLIFINKRGVYKNGRTWSELATSDRINPSSHKWISRYGSVTFNCFGRDFPDGGMNEAGLYIWEMNDDPVYPKNENLPKLNQSNWMQYILDNFSTTDEAIQCAYDIEIEGWGWQFFIGDASGKTAAVNFMDGKVVVHAGDDMPIPGLFNTPYERELEFLKYYEGFGGLYPIDLNDPEVTRFAKTARMLRDYKSSGDIVSDGFYMLDKIKVYDEPEWSVTMDVVNRTVYFKTRLNPKVKSFSMAKLDFSNQSPVLIQDMDIAEGGDVLSGFSAYSNDKMKDFIDNHLSKALPESFFTEGGLTKEQWVERFSTHTDDVLQGKNHFFVGVWKDKTKEVMLTLSALQGSIKGQITNYTDTYELDHISMIGNHFKCTFKTKGKQLIEVQGDINGEEMDFGFRDARYPMNKRVLYKSLD